MSCSILIELFLFLSLKFICCFMLKSNSITLLQPISLSLSLSAIFWTWRSQPYISASDSFLIAFKEEKQEEEALLASGLNLNFTITMEFKRDNTVRF